MEDKFPRHVFISYARKDAEFVKRLKDDLEAAGIPIWVDTQNLVPGTPDWEKSIRRAIAISFAVILIGSPAVPDSEYVYAELSIAEGKRVPVIPVWFSGDSWIDCAPIDLARAQYADLRGEGYQASLQTLTARVQEVVERRRKKHGLIPNPNVDQYGQDSFDLPGVPGYVSVLLDDGPTGQEKGAVFYADGYASLQDLLDDLYVHYLNERFAPVSYGREWVLEENWVHPRVLGPADSPRSMRINPRRLLLPWEWLGHQPPSVVVSFAPYWQRSPLSHYGIFAQSVLTVRELSESSGSPDYPTLAELVYGIAVNNQLLYREILMGGGKQPVSALSAGFVEVVPFEDIDASDYEYHALAVDYWGGLFAGQAVRETGKVFNPGDHDPYASYA